MEGVKKYFPSCCCSPDIEPTSVMIFKKKNEELKLSSLDPDEVDQNIEKGSSSKIIIKKNIGSSQGRNEKERVASEEFKGESRLEAVKNKRLFIRKKAGSCSMSSVLLRSACSLSVISSVKSKTEETNEFFNVVYFGKKETGEEAFVGTKEDLLELFFSVTLNAVPENSFLLGDISAGSMLFAKISNSFELEKGTTKISFCKSFLDVLWDGKEEIHIEIGNQKSTFNGKETPDVTLGRNNKNTLVLADEFASKFQMSFKYRLGVWKLKDGYKKARSTNGNWVMLKGPAKLENSALIRCWKNIFEISF